MLVFRISFIVIIPKIVPDETVPGAELARLINNILPEFCVKLQAGFTLRIGLRFIYQQISTLVAIGTAHPDFALPKLFYAPFVKPHGDTFHAQRILQGDALVGVEAFI